LSAEAFILRFNKKLTLLQYFYCGSSPERFYSLIGWEKNS